MSLANTCSVGLKSASKAAGRAGRHRWPWWRPRRLPPVGGKVVHLDHIPQGGREELLHVGQERRTIHRAVQHERRHQSGAVQPGHDCRSAPMLVRGSRGQSARFGGPAIAPDHVCAGTGLIDAHETLRVYKGKGYQDRQSRRRMAPSGWSCSAAPSISFLCDSPSRRSVDQIVVRHPASMPRATNAAWISAGVTLLVAAVSSRSRSSYPASNG